MSLRTPSDTLLQQDLRSVLVTMHCLSEIAGQRGDAQSARLLHHAAALLEATILQQRNSAAQRVASVCAFLLVSYLIEPAQSFAASSEEVGPRQSWSGRVLAR